MTPLSDSLILSRAAFVQPARYHIMPPMSEHFALGAAAAKAGKTADECPYRSANASPLPRARCRGTHCGRGPGREVGSNPPMNTVLQTLRERVAANALDQARQGTPRPVGNLLTFSVSPVSGNFLRFRTLR